jgi:hypothetical protein
MILIGASESMWRLIVEPFGRSREDAAMFSPPRTERSDTMQAAAPSITSSSSAPVVVRRDTGAWRVQVWISFGLAVVLCATGLAWLPGDDLDRAFMVMGYLFCLTSAFGLAKFIRDNEQRRADTPSWKWVVWGGFVLAMGLTAWGLWRMNVVGVWKAYLAVSWLFLISSVFTLAKTLRDAYEADRLDARAARAARDERDAA